MIVDDDLAEYATPKQKLYITAVNLHGGVRAAARALGLSKDRIGQSLRALKARAALLGYAPDAGMHNPNPEGFKVKRVSNLRDMETGALKLQWQIMEPDKERAFDMIREWITDLVDNPLFIAPALPRPLYADMDLLVVIPMGDPHFGMRAWAEECGDNFDLKIAEEQTKGAIDRLVESAPSAHTCILLNLGDMFHADNQSNTSKSGHQLDVDGRWTKVLQVALRSMIHAILRAAQKHAHVIFRIDPGNHDGHSSFALAVALDAYFHNDPRVTIDLSKAAHWYFEFGKVLLGSTHGDTTKMGDLMMVMAADKEEAWGRTKFRHWLAGHIHHDKVQEYPGGKVEYFRTLAARDAWHMAQGYRAGRDMRMIVHHREYGEIERHRCDIAMLAA